jgi:hypothetical protein
MILKLLKEGVSSRRNRQLAALGAFIFMVASLVMGMTHVPGSQAPLALWLVFAIVAVIFVRMAFPDVWNYLFWLMAGYGAAFGGAVCFTALPALFPEAAFWMWFSGGFLELLAVAVFIYLILHVKGIRDEVAGITVKSAASARVDQKDFDSGRYVPLGLWTLWIILFYSLTNLSAVGWYRWASGADTLSLYIISELALMVIGIQILWLVQTRFHWGERPEILPAIASLVQPQSAGGRMKGRAPEKCPACSAGVKTETRRCRSCGKQRDFYWCPTCEVYLVRCPSCRKYTAFGRKLCSQCGTTAPDAFSCTCGARYPPSKWPKSRS